MRTILARWPLWLLLGVLAAYLLFPAPWWDKLALVGFAIDPQRPDHSIFFGAVYMPIEARKAGMYGGFLLALVVFAAGGRGRAARFAGRWWAVALIALGATMLVDGLNAVAYDLRLPHLYAPSTTLRLLTGLALSPLLAAYIGPAFNQVAWERPLRQTPLQRPADLLPVAGLYAVYALAALAGWPPLFWPVSLIAVAGLAAYVVMLVAIGLGSFLPMPRARTLPELAPLILSALLVSVAVLSVPALLRLWLLGWGPMPALR